MLTIKKARPNYGPWEMAIDRKNDSKCRLADIFIT